MPLWARAKWANKMKQDRNSGVRGVRKVMAVWNWWPTK